MFIWKIRRIVKVRVEQALAYFKRRRDAMQLMEEDAAIWALEKQIPINYKIYLQDLTALMNRYGDNNEKKENENE